MVRAEKSENYRNKHIKRLQKISAQISSAVLVLFLVTGCSQYKSSWSCKNQEGIGCSSISYADRIARKNIILNDDNANEYRQDDGQSNVHNTKNKHKKLLIKERYSDFKKQNQEEVDFE